MSSKDLVKDIYEYARFDKNPTRSSLPFESLGYNFMKAMAFTKFKSAVYVNYQNKSDCIIKVKFKSFADIAVFVLDQYSKKVKNISLSNKKEHKVIAGNESDIIRFPATTNSIAAAIKGRLGDSLLELLNNLIILKQWNFVATNFDNPEYTEFQTNIELDSSKIATWCCRHKGEHCLINFTWNIDLLSIVLSKNPEEITKTCFVDKACKPNARDNRIYSYDDSLSYHDELSAENVRKLRVHRKNKDVSPAVKFIEQGLNDGSFEISTHSKHLKRSTKTFTDRNIKDLLATANELNKPLARKVSMENMYFCAMPSNETSVFFFRPDKEDGFEEKFYVIGAYPVLSVNKARILLKKCLEAHDMNALKASA